MAVRRRILWALLAVAGLLIAVALTMAATKLTSQDIGLEAEPVNAGDQLAPIPERSSPPATDERDGQRSRREDPDADDDGRRESQPPATGPGQPQVPAPTTPIQPSVQEGEQSADDDSGQGRGRGRGRGRGGDD